MELLKILLEASLYSAVLFAGIMIFKKLAKGKVSPVLSFALWFLLLARLCVPLTIQSGFHLFTLPETPAQTTAQQTQQGAGGGSEPGALDGLLAFSGRSMPQTDGGRPADGTAAEAASAISDQPAASMSIYDFFLLVWLVVLSTILIWMAYIAARVFRVVKKKSVPASGHINELYAVCRAEMGLKRRLPLMVTESIASPALVVSLRPRILLPLRFVKTATGGEIRLALRHEIMHYKRMDHLVCILMRILSAVYWFNPVIWLAEREIVSDMETACDNLIVRDMKKTEKTYYANMILSMFARKAEAPFVLGMALPNTKNIAEKRIRGIYMKSKTKKSVKTAALLLSMILLVACFTTACQPAEAEKTGASLPEAQPVSVQAETQAPAPEEERYQSSVQLSDGVTVNYNAAVVEPGGPVPVATVECRDFTEADFKKVTDYFLAGKDLYKPWARTKAEVQAEIDALEKENADMITKKDAFLAENPWAEELYQAMGRTAGIESKVSDPIKARYSLTDEDLSTYMDIVARTESTGKMNEYGINKDREELKTAPETRQKEPAVLQYGDVNMGRVAGVESGHETLTEEDMIFNKLQVWTENEDGTISEVNSVRMDGGKRSSIYYFRKITNSIYYAPLEPRPALAIPREQAQRLAVDAAAAICPELSLNGTRIGQYYDPDTKERTDAYYIFTFTRSVNSVPVTADSGSGMGYMDNDTEEVTYFEVAEVSVDNEGILHFEWRAPYDNIRVTQEDAKVISLQEAMQAFEVNTLNGLESREYLTQGDRGFNLDSIEIDIGKIQLGLSRVPDGEEGFKLIPTWDFFGTAVAYRDGEEVQFNRFGQSQGNDSMGTVNALDGSEVNRMGNISTW